MYTVELSLFYSFMFKPLIEMIVYKHTIKQSNESRFFYMQDVVTDLKCNSYNVYHIRKSEEILITTPG